MTSTADYTVTQGDTQPVFTRQLNYGDGSVVDLTGATAQLVLRDLTASAPLTLTGATSTGATPAAGIVTYTPTVADTSNVGGFMGKFVITFAGGDVMSFPTDGYLWVEIEPNLSTPGGQQLVGLPDVKDHLNIPRQENRHDAKLVRLIHAVRPLIENRVGPVVIDQFDEWHTGGGCSISLNRKPSTAPGTSPVIIPIACSEYIASVEWPLTIIATPDQGQMYSCIFDTRLAQVTRRTAGGGEQPFPIGDQAVHVVYQAGQSSIPENVRYGTLEMIRENYDVTQAVGRGSLTVADDQAGPDLKVGMTPYVRQLLAPNRRHPSIA